MIVQRAVRPRAASSVCATLPPLRAWCRRASGVGGGVGGGGVGVGLGISAADLASLPLLQEPAGLPRLRPASSLPPPTVQVSTLANGLRVCTQETYGQVASLALFLDAGSMYESAADGTIGACPAHMP